MIRSMTGFGRAEQSDGNWRCGVEIRSVNGRFLEIRFKLPGGLYHHEEELKKIINGCCARGKIDCTVTLSPDSQDTTALSFNKPLLRQYAQLLHAFQQELGSEIQVTLGNLANIKDLILTDQWTEQDSAVQGLMANTLRAAVAELAAMRETEGRTLQAELQGRFEEIRATMKEMEPLTRELPDRFAKRLKENLARMMAPAQPDDDRIVQEIAIMADRYDVTEELSRIDAHLVHLGQMLNEGGQLGRKFDFLLQEINREANTLAAKSNDAAVSARVVDIKSELERLREQIQNIE